MQHPAQRRQCTPKSGTIEKQAAEASGCSVKTQADGRAGNDTILGDDGDDTIAGDDGRDLTFGQDGDDVIDANGAADTLPGGDGADVETIDESFTLSATLLSGLDT